MNSIHFQNTFLEAAVFGIVAVLLVLAVLTMRSIVQRERAITFGKGREDAEARRAAYEARWRTGS